MKLKDVFKPVARFFTKLQIADLEAEKAAAEGGFIMVRSGPVFTTVRVDPQTAENIKKRTQERIDLLKATLR